MQTCFQIKRQQEISETTLDGALGGTVKKCSDEARLPSGLLQDEAKQLCMGEQWLDKVQQKKEKKTLSMCSEGSSGFRDKQMLYLASN